MAETTGASNWELEPEDSNPEYIEPELSDADKKDADDGVDNITPSIPPELWDDFVWRAIRAAIDASRTRDEVIQWVILWNKGNDPQLPEKELIKKVLWALRNWQHKFRKR